MKNLITGRQRGFDQFGNPEGRAFDLGGVEDERLRGEKILLYSVFRGGYEWHHAQQAVAERNIQMDIIEEPSSRCTLTSAQLANYSQLWYVSDATVKLDDQQVTMIAKYVKSGNGLLIWADNDPFYADANLLAAALIGARFSGNKPGGKVMEPGERLKRGLFIEHPLTHGVSQLFEGLTICTVSTAPHLTILAQSHDGQNCMACFELDDQRIVLDTGFTKLSHGAFHRTAGTARYFRNIAFWLARGSRGIQYTSFTPGRGTTATIEVGRESPRYKYTVPATGSNALLLQWEGQATLGLVAQDTQGRTIFDGSSPKSPVRFQLPPGSGEVVFWVKGVQVPHSGFPYVLTLVQSASQASTRQSVPTGTLLQPPVQAQGQAAGSTSTTAQPQSAPRSRVFCPNCGQMLNRQTGECSKCHWRE